MTKYCGLEQTHGVIDATGRFCVVCRVVLIGMTQEGGAMIMCRIERELGGLMKRCVCDSSLPTGDDGASTCLSLRGNQCSGSQKCAYLTSDLGEFIIGDGGSFKIECSC